MSQYFQSPHADGYSSPAASQYSITSSRLQVIEKLIRRFKCSVKHVRHFPEKQVPDYIEKTKTVTKAPLLSSLNKTRQITETHISKKPPSKDNLSFHCSQTQATIKWRHKLKKTLAATAFVIKIFSISIPNENYV